MQPRCRELLATVLVAVAVACASGIIHHPAVGVSNPLPGLSYSDIVSVYYTVVFDAVDYTVLSNYTVETTLEGDVEVVVLGNPLERWFSGELAETFTKRRLCPAPYLDYGFEYPPLVGALWYASTCYSFMLLPEEYNVSVLVSLSATILEAHYAVHAVALATALAVSSALLYSVLSRINPREAFARTIIFLLLPSTVVYTVYNWDALALVFTLLSVYMLLKGRLFRAGLSLGLAASAKLLPAASGMVLLAWMVRGLRKRELDLGKVGSFIAGAAVGATPLLALPLLAPHGFAWMYKHVSGWYCENCVYNLFTMDVYSPLNRYAFVASALSFNLALSFLVLKGRVDVVRGFALAAASAAVLNYIYTPQMVLLVTPMLLIAAPRRLLPIVALADAFNTLIMAFFFNRGVVVSALHLLGIPHAEPASPFDVRSVIQLFANARNMLHMLALSTTAKHLAKRATE